MVFPKRTDTDNESPLSEVSDSDLEFEIMSLPQAKPTVVTWIALIVAAAMLVVFFAWLNWYAGVGPLGIPHP